MLTSGRALTRIEHDVKGTGPFILCCRRFYDSATFTPRKLMPVQ